MQKKKWLPAVIIGAVLLCLLLLTVLTLRPEENRGMTVQREPDRERLNTTVDTLVQSETSPSAEAQEQMLPDSGEGEALTTQATSEATPGKRLPGEGGTASPIDALIDSDQASQSSQAASGQNNAETTGNNDGAFDLPPDDF